MNRRARDCWAAVAGLMTLLLLAPGCPPSGDAGPTAATDAPNLVLIVVDTLRADHLGCYGYQRPTSPRVDAFAGSATLYTRSLSSAPWTVPTHASIFTGQPPLVHGAHTFSTDQPERNVNPLHEDRVTLAELLTAEGYRTAAFVGNVAFLDPRWQLDQGFETYEVERLHADALNERAFAWLEQVTGPYFLFVNYIDAHRPYNTSPRPGFLDPPASGDPTLVNQLSEEVLPATKPVPAGLVRQVVDQYDTGIANMDEHFGALLDRLDRAGAGRDTVIVLTSDHGEYFGEHHLVEHSKDVYQPAIQVPLIVRGAGQVDARIVETLVVSHDLPRLILAEFPEEMERRLSGFFPDAPGSHLVISENYYTRAKDLIHPEWGWRFQRVRQAVFEWPYKLIHSSDGKHELYDLDLDPAEQHNLIDDRPEVARRLTAGLQELEKSRAVFADGPDTSPLDEDLRRKLEELGYLEKQEE